MKASLLFLILAGLVSSTASADEELPVDRQLQIIADYAAATAQHARLPSWALEATETEAPDTPVKCGLSATMTFRQNLDRIDRGLIKSLGIRTPGSRPSLSDSLDSPLGEFRIHYTTEGYSACYQADVDVDGNGHPDYIDRMAAILDSVRVYMLDTLGYPAPPPDQDSVYDVYVQNFSLALYGSTELDYLVDSGLPTEQATSFLHLRSDYTSLPHYGNRPFDALRVTCAHEYYHAIHLGLDPRETERRPINDEYGSYWLEMSAVWMEEEIYDNVNDYYYYLPVFFADPATSIQSYASYLDQHPYASAIWTVLLVERFGRDAVREIWLRCRDYGIGPSFLDAADDVIDSLSGGAENWGSFFSEFALANYFTGLRSSYLPVELRSRRYWKCDAGTYPDCDDSLLVTDTLLDWDWYTEETTSFTGYEEAGDYPHFPDSMLHIYYDYPVLITGDSAINRPEANGLFYMDFENPGLLPWDTSYWLCNSGVWPNCTDSQRVTDTSLGYDFIHIDSNIIAYLALGDGGRYNPSYIPTLSQGWGVNTIYQLQSHPDSFVVDNAMLPDDIVWRTEFTDRERYRSIRLALSPAAPDTGYFANLLTRVMGLYYLVGDTTLIDSSRTHLPAAVLKPFPNPAVVSELAEPRVRFAFQVSTDERARPEWGNPHLVIDIYNIAGERVATLDSLSASAQQYLGIHYADWDLRNDAGNEVASGVYLAYARLWSAERKGVLLAEDHKKVAVIR